MDTQIRSKRKIQQLGSSTLGVTIPKEWIEQQNLTKGDYILIQEDEITGSILAIPANQTVHNRSVTIQIDTLSPSELTQVILSQYILCRQTINIQSSQRITEEQYKSITQIEERLIGVGIIEDQSAQLTVRCSVSAREFNLSRLIERIHQTEARMRTDALTGLLEDDADARQRVKHRRGRTQSLFFLSLRLLYMTYRNPKLNKSIGLDTGLPLMGYRSVVQDLVLMDDVNQRIALLAEDAQCLPLDNNTATLVSDIGIHLEEAIESTIDGITEPEFSSSNIADHRLTEVREAIDTFNTYLDGVRPKPLLALQRISMLLDRHSVLTEDIIEAAMRLFLRSESGFLSVVDTDSR